MLKYEDKFPKGKENCADDGASNLDNSNNDGNDSWEVICRDDVRSGKCKLVFGHPEAFLSSNLVLQHLARVSQQNNEIMA